jgi:uncharacterized protein
MKRYLVLIALCFAFISNVLAQSGADAPASKEDVERYLQAMHSHEMMKQMVVAMAQPMHQMVHDQLMKDKDRLPPDFEDRMNKLMDEMMRDMPMDEMLDAMVPTYQKHFTKGDIDALIVFYSSPTGQKVLRELPAVTAEALQAMTPLIRKSVDHMTERMQQEVAQMLKDSQKKPGDNAPAQN